MQILAARLPDYQPALLDQLGASGEIVWCGAGAIGSDDGWIAVATAEHASILATRGMNGLDMVAGGALGSGTMPAGNWEVRTVADMNGDKLTLDMTKDELDGLEKWQKGKYEDVKSADSLAELSR